MWSKPPGSSTSQSCCPYFSGCTLPNSPLLISKSTTHNSSVPSHKTCDTHKMGTFTVFACLETLSSWGLWLLCDKEVTTGNQSLATCQLPAWTNFYNKSIRLIRLGISKTKLTVFELTTYWFSVRSHNHYTKEPTVSGPKSFQSVCLLKDFNTQEPITVSILTDSSWIHLILLIKLIQCKIGKIW